MAQVGRVARLFFFVFYLCVVLVVVNVVIAFVLTSVFRRPSFMHPGLFCTKQCSESCFPISAARVTAFHSALPLMRARRKGNTVGPDARQNEYQITLSANEVREEGGRVVVKPLFRRETKLQLLQPSSSNQA